MQEMKQVIIKEETCNSEVEKEEDGATITVTDLDVKSVKSMGIVQTSAISDLTQTLHHHSKPTVTQETSFSMST